MLDRLTHGLSTAVAGDEMDRPNGRESGDRSVYQFVELTVYLHLMWRIDGLGERARNHLNVWILRRIAYMSKIDDRLRYVLE